jgi:tetratricopeptide (TPR) repeat protein
MHRDLGLSSLDGWQNALAPLGAFGTLLILLVVLMTLAMKFASKFFERFLEVIAEGSGARFEKWHSARRAAKDRKRIRQSLAPANRPVAADSSLGRLGSFTRHGGPFADRDPIFLLVGEAAATYASAVDWSESAVEPTVLIVPDVLAPRSSGQLLSLADALDRVDGTLDDGNAQYLHVILLPHLSRTIENDIVQNVVSTILGRRRPTFIAWRQIRGLPAGHEATIELASGGIGPHELLSSLPSHLAEGVTVSVRGLSTSIERALAIVLWAAGEPATVPEVDLRASEVDYKAQIALCVGEYPQKEWRGRVDKFPIAMRADRAFEGVLRYVHNGQLVTVEVADLLEHDACFLVHHTDSQGPSHVTALEHAENLYLARLEQAIDMDDEDTALAALVRAGRAWLDWQDAHRARAAMVHCLARFGPESKAGSWSYFLLSVNEGFRQAAPRQYPLDDYAIQTAHPSLDLIYRAERMDALSSEGEMLTACALSTDVRRRLVHATYDDAGTRYVMATALFLTSNVLRRGGRYGEAEELLRQAEPLLDTQIPSHAAQALQIQYGLVCCAAVAGEGFLIMESGGSTKSQAFSHALTDITNSNAAWSLGQIHRALGYAQRARETFQKGNYSSYERRAGLLTDLLQAWSLLDDGSGGSPEDVAFAYPILKPILTPPRSSTLDFSRISPSAAAGLIEIGVRFGRGPDRIAIEMPHVVDVDSEDWRMRSLGTVRGWSEARAVLRTAMGVAVSASVALLPDASVRAEEIRIR